MVELYRDHHIFVMTEPSAGEWVPLVRIMWLKHGKHEQADIIVTESFITGEQAEQYGLRVGKSWVDKRIESNSSPY